MSAFNALKSAVKASGAYRNFDNIEIGVYKVLGFSFVITRYGQQVVVTTPEFKCFLPDRFSKYIRTVEALAELNATPCVMRFSGKDATRRNRVMVDFDMIPEQQQQDGQEMPWNSVDSIEIGDSQDSIGVPSTSQGK